MEDPITHNNDVSSTVDTTRPFTSVKEAVAIFGERLLVGDINIYSPKPFSDPASSAVQQEPKEVEEDNGVVLDTLKKLEAELEKTKAELKLLKERGSETEVALATLNAELHMNMSKLAQAEAVAAGKAAAATKTVRFEIEERKEKGGGDNNENDEDRKEVVEKKKEYIIRKKKEDSKTLAHILSLGENDHLLFGRNKNKSMKQKPIIPLFGDLLFFKRKSSSTTHHHNNNHNPLYASPF